MERIESGTSWLLRRWLPSVLLGALTGAFFGWVRFRGSAWMGLAGMLAGAAAGYASGRLGRGDGGTFWGFRPAGVPGPGRRPGLRGRPAPDRRIPPRHPCGHPSHLGRRDGGRGPTGTILLHGADRRDGSASLPRHPHRRLVGPLRAVGPGPLRLSLPGVLQYGAFPKGAGRTEPQPLRPGGPPWPWDFSWRREASEPGIIWRAPTLPASPRRSGGSWSPTPGPIGLVERDGQPLPREKQPLLRFRVAAFDSLEGRMGRNTLDATRRRTHFSGSLRRSEDPGALPLTFRLTFSPDASTLFLKVITFGPEGRKKLLFRGERMAPKPSSTPAGTP